MCCGVGNLEVKHSNPRKVFMSTLDQEDVDVMKATKTCIGAVKFSYDYLNDDITEDGNIDYSLTNKVPEELRKAIKEGKKILVLINPPYAEAGEFGTGSKKSVSKSKVADIFMSDYGKATNELFVQFIARLQREVPNATLAMFSKLKYVNAPNFEKFREKWNAEYKGGFIVHSKSFEGLKGDFPIGFLVWKTNHLSKNRYEISEITTDILNKQAIPIGEKSFYNIPNKDFLSGWIQRAGSDVSQKVPLRHAVVPSSSNARSLWNNEAVGYLVADANDLQQANSGTLTLSGANGVGHRGGWYITPSNILHSSIVFSVRRLIPHTWINDRDQFLQPNKELSEEFKNDCLIWMLFNGSNLTASANDLEWNEKKWSIVNHFIPYSEEEVNAYDRFESDFMVNYLKDKKLSSEARDVLEAGRVLWRSYFEYKDSASVRDELKLNRPDVGWYQVRKALQKRNESGDYPPISFQQFEETYKTLTEKLRPQVYEYGFLKL